MREWIARCDVTVGCDNETNKTIYAHAGDVFREVGAARFKSSGIGAIQIQSLDGRFLEGTPEALSAIFDIKTE